MNKFLMINGWLLLASWSLYLNGALILAVFAALLGSLILLYSESEVAYLRITALCTGAYLFTLIVLYAGHIPYFFPDLRIFMIFVIFDAGIVNEALSDINSPTLAKAMAVMSGIFAVLCLIIMALPQDDYSIFGKSSLFVMGCFIFLPFLLPLMAHWAIRTIRSLHIDKVFKKI